MARKPVPEVHEISGEPYEYELQIVGESHYYKEIASLCKPNPEFSYSKRDIKKKGLFDQRIYHYMPTSLPAKLVPEPNNAYDKDAIAVVINKKKVGYISRVETAEVRELLATNEVLEITAMIEYGEYNYYSSDTGRGGLVDYEFGITLALKCIRKMSLSVQQESAPIEAPTGTAMAGLKRPAQCKVCEQWIERPSQYCPYCHAKRKLLFCRMNAGASIAFILTIVIAVVWIAVIVANM